MSLLRLALVVASATAAKKPPPKRVALVSFAAPWDYGPYAHNYASSPSTGAISAF